MEHQYTEHYEQPMQQPANGMAIAALICGIFTIVFPIPILSLIIGVVGIILAVKARKTGVGGMAIAGLVCSIIGTLWTLLIMAFIGLIVWMGLYWESIFYDYFYF